MIIDYSHWDIYDGASEGSGRSEKVWLINKETGEIGLFKYTKSDTTKENISEKLALDLAGLIGIECAKIEIGRFNSRVGSMSYLINNENEILIEGIYLINKKYPNYNPHTMKDDINEEYYSLEMILNSLADYNLRSDFLKIIVFDFIIGNTDRHQNNWAVLQSNNKIRLCPLYDNGSSLCCYIEEKNLDLYLRNDRYRFKSIVNSKSKSRIRINKKIRKEPTQLEMLKYVMKNYYDDVIGLIKTANKNITGSAIDNIFKNYDDTLLSNKRKIFIERFLFEKLKLINKIY